MLKTAIALCSTNLNTKFQVVGRSPQNIVPSFGDLPSDDVFQGSYVARFVPATYLLKGAQKKISLAIKGATLSVKM
jgi:hypothetical protein